MYRLYIYDDLDLTCFGRGVWCGREWEGEVGVIAKSASISGHARRHWTKSGIFMGIVHNQDELIITQDRIRAHA